MRYRIDQNKKRGLSSGTMIGSGTVVGSEWMEFSSTGQELLVLYSEKRLVSGYQLGLVNSINSNNNININNYINNINNTTTNTT